MDKNKKNFIILFVFIVFGLVCIFYLSVRLLLFNKGYSLSDLFFPSRNISEIINEESAENLSSDFIPGITQENLRTELTGSGFECSNPELSEKNLYRWVCWKETGTIYQEIYIFSRSLEKIDFLDMNITQSESPSDEISLEYFFQIVDWVDTTRHKLAVQSWIKQTLPDIDEIRELEEADFGGIHYRLYGLGNARSLEIGRLPE